ncbi:hypothetical protein FOZ60_007085 [Perkinsus olseni]|uniref:Uncharacterized protein n=1 Tax=Perkinsus olseni TaxID=32597 RepID=A0A7J6NPH1_PEROL|nr:hypothetical protein FOZ60_007085 [Perkinsus olseni]
MIRLCALTSVVAASHTLDMSRHGDESEISASPGTSASELGLPDINVKLGLLLRYRDVSTPLRSFTILRPLTTPLAVIYGSIDFKRTNKQRPSVGLVHMAERNVDALRLASLVSSDNDILSDLIAVSKGHSPGDGTQMEKYLVLGCYGLRYTSRD